MCCQRGCRWFSEIFCVNFKEEKGNRDLRLQPSLSFLSEAWADPRSKRKQTGTELESSLLSSLIQVQLRKKPGSPCGRAETARLLVFWFWWKCPHIIFYLANISKLRYVFDVSACTRRRADTRVFLFLFLRSRSVSKDFHWLWMFLLCFCFFEVCPSCARA